MQKRLYRSRNERMVSGVCGGLAEYFNIDPTIVRLITVLITIVTGGLGIVAYIIMAIVTPVENSRSSEPRETIRENVQEMKQTAENIGQDIHSSFSSKDSSGTNGANREPREYHHTHRGGIIVGIIILIIGVIALLSNFNIFHWFAWAVFWPVILILIGILIIFARRNR
jgi:phage shock protein C